MIVRNVDVNNLAGFDFFNDGNDTMRWLVSESRFEDAALLRDAIRRASKSQGEQVMSGNVKLWRERNKQTAAAWNHICDLAEQLLEDDKPADYERLLRDCKKGNGRSELQPLFDAIEDGGFHEMFLTRCDNYNRGLRGVIFDRMPEE